MAADFPEILDWCEELWGGCGNFDTYRRSPVHRSRDVPNFPGRRILDGPYIPAGVQREVLDRDGYFCRYCGIPVILQKAMRDAYPETARWGAGNVEKHTAFQALDIDFDHIISRSRGGRNTPENLVVSCAPCNCGRNNFTLEEVGVTDPRTIQAGAHEIPPELSKWGGLTRILPGGSRDAST